MLDTGCKVPCCIRCIQAAVWRLALTAAAPAPRNAWLGTRCDACPAGHWINLDDANAPRLVSESDIVTPEAYILFYRRRPEAQRDDGALSVQHMPDNARVAALSEG